MSSFEGFQNPTVAAAGVDSEDIPELYCLGCLTEFGVLTPAVFAPPRDSTTIDAYAVCCPVAGLVKKDTGALCHGGPYDHAIGSDGRQWKYMGDTRGFVAFELTSVNGYTFSRPRRYLRRKLKQWKVAIADQPPIFLNDDTPDDVLVLEDFDWETI
jgi:hypothetical protein